MYNEIYKTKRFIPIESVLYIYIYDTNRYWRIIWLSH